MAHVVWDRVTRDEVLRATTVHHRYAADAPGAEIQLLDGGHFLLESFLGRTLS